MEFQSVVSDALGSISRSHDITTTDIRASVGGRKNLETYLFSESGEINRTRCCLLLFETHAPQSEYNTAQTC